LNYWAAVEDLASNWSTSPVVLRLKTSIAAPINSNEQYAWLDGISQLKVLFSGDVHQPFKLAQHLPFIGGALPEMQLPHEFINDTVVVHRAAVGSLAWIRAQLPGYPIFKTPHFARNTNSTTDEFTFRIPWRREDLASGLQFKGLDARIAASLQLQRPERFELSVQNLLKAVRQTDEWIDFELSRARLTTEDSKLLSAARLHVSECLAPAALDEFEPQVATIRAKRRAEVVQEGIAKLDGSAKDYALAFDRIDALLEDIVIDFVSHFVFFGGPKLVKPLGEIQFVPGKPGKLMFDATGWLDAGALIRIDDPIFSGHARVNQVEVHTAAGAEDKISIGASLLE
jgi:hypothetical protein